jgi:hypothetical protein
MSRKLLASPRAITTILIAQFVPLVLFPSASFAPTSQEWWLPVLLAVMVMVADVELIVRRTTQVRPWNLLLFAQGFNIISRLMMLWGHATVTVGGATVLNLPYIALTLAAMAMSAWLLWYLELPEVRLGLLAG